MTLVADHSTAGAIIGGSLRKAGFSGIVRYAAAGRSNVNITPAEIHDLKANGLAIGVVLEHEADWLLRPASIAGRVSGSRDICRACGLPDGAIYMAADFDATNGGPTAPGSPGDRNMQTILKSLEIAGSVIGRQHVGFYGSVFAIEWLISNAPWLQWYWQTEAWSHGQPPHPHAALYQRAQSQTVAGVQVDIDLLLKPNFGQRVPTPTKPTKPRRKHKPVPLPPKPQPKITAAAIAGALATGLQALLHAKGIAGLKLTPAESGVISLAAAILAGYLTPSRQP